MALFAAGPFIGLLVRPDGWSWQEMPTLPSINEPLPEVFDPLTQVSPNTRAAFTLVLVDSTTKIVHAVRLFTVSPHLTLALRREVADRWAGPIAEADFLTAVRRWYDDHPTPKDTLKYAIARCKAGA